MQYSSFMETIGKIIDTLGVFIIIVGVVAGTVWFICRAHKVGLSDAYVTYRHIVGRAILLGLEFLVGGDIIRTVAVSPTLMSVTVLGGIVIIRTFLSMSLQLEIDGRWPWQGVAAVRK